MAGTLLTVQAGPAVLLKAYPVEVIRGHYFLGRRMAYGGETVKVSSLDGPRAKVLTLDGDVLTVYCADLHLLPDPSPTVTQSSPQAVQRPAPVAPSPSPAATPALVPDIFSSPSPAPTAGATAGAQMDNPGKKSERRDVAVQCSCLTKKGTRCTRMTRSPNGLCWQHGGD